MLHFSRDARVGVAALALGLALSVRASADTNSDDQLREDVLFCEDALARLQTCCPGFDPTKVSCLYHDHTTVGCGGSARDHASPALSLSESQCIRDRACGELVASGVCARAQDATPYTQTSNTNYVEGRDPTTTSSSAHPPVCP